MDNFKNTSGEFYDNLAKGKVDHKDFERYVYGKGANKYSDERDELESEQRQKLRNYEREAMEFKLPKQ